MAKIRAVSDFQSTSNTTSITVPLPEHETNDLLLMFLTKDDSAGGSHSTPGGWTKGGEQNSAGTTTASHKAAWYYKVAASANETDPNVTNSDSDTWTAVVMSIEGVDTGTPIDVSNTNGVQDNAGAPYTAASVTTNTNNALVFYACATSTAAAVAYPGFHNVAGVDSGADGVGVAFTLKKTNGATVTCDFYTDNINANTVLFTVAVRDGSSGAIIPGYISTTSATLIHPLRGVNPIHASDTWQTALTNYPRVGRRDWNYVVFEDVGTGFTDETTDANDAGTADFTPFPTTEAVNDYCAFGYYKPFQNIVFDYASGTAGVGGVLAWEYWNGTAWVVLTSVTDGTTGFTAVAANNLQVRWAMPANWKTTTVNSVGPYYYVRARVTTVYTVNPVLDRSSVSSIQTVYNAGASAADTGVNPFENSFNNISVASTTQYYGRNITLGATVSLTGTFIVGTMLFGTPRDFIDKGRMREGGGSAVILADSSHNHKAWLIGSYLDKDTKSDARNTFVVQWGQTTDTTFGRTLTDPTDTLANVVILSMDPRGASANYWNQLIAVGIYRINGGTSTNPIDVEEFLTLGKAYNLELFPSGVFYIPVTIGGGDAVHVNLNLFNFSFPTITTHPSFFIADPYTKTHVDKNALGFTLDARSGDTLKMTNGSISSTSAWKFEITSTASSGATWDFSGLSLVQATVTTNSSIPLSGMTFTACGAIDPAGCTFSNNTISSGRDGHGLVVNSTANMALVTGCTFTSNTRAIRLSTTGTFTFNNLTFTSNTYDVENFNNAINMSSYVESNRSTAQALGNGTISRVGQSFTGNGKYLASAQFYIKKIGTPTGNATANVYAHSGTFGTSSVPTGAALATSGNFDVSTLDKIFYSLSTFNFTGANEITLTDATNYVVTLEYSGGNTENYIEVGVDNTSPSHGGNFATYDGSWTAVSGSDACFYIGAEADAYTENNQNTTQALGNGTIVGVGQSFTGDGGTLANVQFYLSKTGSPTGNATAKLYAHSGTFGTSSVPTGAALATSDTLNVANLTGSLVLNNLFFTGENLSGGDNNTVLTNGTNYVVTLEYSGGDGSNFVNLGVDTTSPTHGGNFATNSGSWSAVSGTDAIFRLRTGGIVVVSATNGSNPSQSKVINTGSPPGSTTIYSAVSITVTVLDSSNNPVPTAQVAAYKTSDNTELMNEDTETVTAGSFVVGVAYTIVTVGTTDFTLIGAASNTVGVSFTATGVGSGTGTASNGIATQTFNYTSNTAIYVRVRKSSTGSTKYEPVSTTGTITTSGYSLTVTLTSDTVADPAL